MRTEPRALREIHDIRLKIHAQTKDMTPEERTTQTKRIADEMMKKYGLAHLKISSRQNT